MRDQSILRIVAKLLIPYILLFALYVQFHGDYGPGGGFQAGVIFAAGVILYGLIFGLNAARGVAPPLLMETLAALGVLIYAGTGVAAMLNGGTFLDYNALGGHGEHHSESADHGGEHQEHPLPKEEVGDQHHGILPRGQHLGILVVELGVGLTVAAVMITIFFAFAGRERVQ
jgi:multicomponent Na+:H+ antiporter subunit B